MTPVRSRTLFARTALVLTPLSLAVMQTVHAGEFEWGEISGRANGSISIGSVWSAENPNGNFINQANADSIGRGHARAVQPEQRAQRRRQPIELAQG